MSGALKGHRKSQLVRLNGVVRGTPRPLGLAAVPNVPGHYITNFHSINNCHGAAHSLAHAHTHTPLTAIKRFLTLARERNAPQSEESTCSEAPGAGAKRLLGRFVGGYTYGCGLLRGVFKDIEGVGLLLWDRPRVFTKRPRYEK